MSYHTAICQFACFQHLSFSIFDQTWWDIEFQFNTISEFNFLIEFWILGRNYRKHIFKEGSKDTFPIDQPNLYHVIRVVVKMPFQPAFGDQMTELVGSSHSSTQCWPDPSDDFFYWAFWWWFGIIRSPRLTRHSDGQIEGGKKNCGINNAIPDTSNQIQDPAKLC